GHQPQIRARRRRCPREPSAGQRRPRGKGGGRGRPGRARRPARRGTRARRGPSRRRQDRPGARLCALDRRGVRAHPGHRRPAARRRRGHEHLQPARGALRVPARTGVRQHRPRRRDQPRLAQDAVGPARVHAGAPRHRRRAHPRGGTALPGHRDPESTRLRGHLPAARGSARSLHGPGLAGLPVRGAGGRHARRARRRRPRSRPGPGVQPQRGARGPGGRDPGARQRGPAALRRRHPRAHPRRRARRARGEPARRPDAPARGQGRRCARLPRPRSARRRPGACARGSLASPPAGARGDVRQRGRSRGARRRRARPRSL
ncbi:MAG: FIG022979: MoxR-like ATPases, partial [uncultured Solirubrobacterales bacterium]